MATEWQPNQTSKLNVKSEKISDLLNMAEVETKAEAEKKEEALEGLKRHMKVIVLWIFSQGNRFTLSMNWISFLWTLMESIIPYYSQFISLSNAWDDSDFQKSEVLNVQVFPKLFIFSLSPSSLFRWRFNFVDWGKNGMERVTLVLGTPSLTVFPLICKSLPPLYLFETFSF